MSSAACSAAARILAGGPTSSGLSSPSLAASTTPSIDVRSHGCATAVVAAVQLLRGLDKPFVFLVRARPDRISMALNPRLVKVAFRRPRARPRTGENSASMRSKRRLPSSGRSPR